MDLLLFDRTRRLLAMGYHVDEHRRDSGYYDSCLEARFSSFVAMRRKLLRKLVCTGAATHYAPESGFPFLGGSMFDT